ncbi:MAG TPA: hypothetical protein VG097_16855 [Gemmata sp.]|jgi:hypothetical protein|nr:hypothetical protein [Gemmata sp.]
MIEVEWQVASDPTPMYLFIQSNSSDRKLQLFGCACCYRWRQEIYYKETEALLEVVERFADGKATTEQVNSIDMASAMAHAGLHWGNSGALADPAIRSLWPKLQLDKVMKNTDALAAQLSLRRAAEKSSRERSYRFWKRGPKMSAEEFESARCSGIAAERKTHCDLLRCIFGNPFRPITLNPSWLTSTVLALAQQMYESRDFSPMPILADALQDAACDNDEILNHCRHPGVHVRGCWCVDLLLDKK